MNTQIYFRFSRRPGADCPQPRNHTRDWSAELRRPRLRRAFLAGLAVFLLTIGTLFAQTFPAGFSQVEVASGISNPTVMAFAPDGRIFVAEQGGRLRVIKNGALLANPFLQVSVNASGERGLIGIALDPNFPANGYLYLYYTTATAPIHNRISRFTANGDLALAGSETLVLDLDNLSSATNHNGGAMHFGKDGKLYVAVGENANPNYAQNLDTYHGKLLRINANGSAPTDNPYPTGSEQRKRVWAYGLRNPYTFAVQAGTGRILVNDVGQNSWEEINEATPANRNFGWPAAEGTSSNTAYANPVFAYGHGSGDGQGCAITGGTFFNPAASNYPASLVGKYFYQDLCNQWINVLDVSGSTAVRTPFATGLPGNAVSLSVSNGGNLHYLSRDNGALYKIIYTNNVAPALTGQPVSVSVAQGQAAAFSVSASGTTPLSYQWQKNGVSIGGATSASYAIASAVAADAGQYRVVVSNAAGSATSNAATLTVTALNGPPVARITSPTDGTIYRAGDVIKFEGTGTYPEGGSLPVSAYNWEVVFHHDDHNHPGPSVSVASDGRSGSFEIPVEGETSANVWYRLRLTVTDSKGLTHQKWVDINPKVVTVNIASNPSGLQVNLDGQPKTTPYSVRAVSGMLLSLGALPSQTLNSIPYAFSGWDQGKGVGGSITVPDDNATYTALFSNGPSLRPADNPAGLINGLQYSYHEGRWSSLPNFATLTPKETGTVATIDPSPRRRNEWFALQFNGYVSVPTDGLYTFFTHSDDGSQLYIGSTLVVENNGMHGARERSGSIGLKAGRHALWVFYLQGTVDAVLSVSYAGPTILKQSIPAGALFRQEAGGRIARGNERGTNSPDPTGWPSASAEKGLVQVFPNPARNYVTIRLNAEGWAGERAARVEISDVLARKVATSTHPLKAGLNDLSVYIGHLANGMHSILIQYGNRKEVKRVLIEK